MEFMNGVAEPGSGFLEGGLASDHLDHITKTEAVMAAGRPFDLVPGQAGDHDAVVGMKAEFAQGSSQNSSASDHDPS